MFREDMTDRERAYGMYKLPKLPPELERDEAVFVLTPEIIKLAKTVRAFIMTFVTQVSELPLAREDGKAPAAVKDKGDSLELADALFLNKINPYRDLDMNTIWRQMVHPLAAVVFEMGPITERKAYQRFPWKAFDIDLEGCGWLEVAGIPTIFGHQFKQLAYDVQKDYSRRDGTEYAGMDLKQTSGGKWFWDKMTDDYSPKLSRASKGGRFQECELLKFFDQDYLYTVAMNQDGPRQVGPFRVGSQASGTMISCVPNPFGRVPVFLIPGNKTALRRPEDEYEPFLLENIVTAMHENVVQSIRATKSRNRAAPRDYLHLDPESYAAELKVRQGPIPPLDWIADKLNVFGGEIKQRPLDDDPDLSSLAAELDARRARYSPADAALINDPDVLKQAPLGSLLAAFDSSARYVSPVVGAQDIFRRQLIEAWHHSIQWVADNHGKAYAEFTLTGAGVSHIRGKKPMREGGQITISPALLDFEHETRVQTSSRSLAQSTALFQRALMLFQPLPDGRPNVGIYQDLIDALDETDAAERFAQLAEETIVGELDPVVKMTVATRFARLVELESGEMIPLQSLLSMMPAPGAPQGQLPAGVPPPTGNQTNSPATEMVAGSSGPNVQV